ncbi:Arc family DNA-binding protein [Stenotrophomonas maltophilia]|uniref:Arc family DNA-binding protein n=1 Tax=Stenotrophomonas maltophilia TaxID=40324 RepID=UPI0021C97D34|nr:Arc family DNA-binding protein [Stenotrophomonas maltophilia]MCU1196168.1 Arc family DNA-binding protein [Stenotrophomonas maltophilia]
MARTDPQVNFRIPAELNERLKEAAAENGRTITAELVQRLEASFRRSVDDEKVVEVVEGLKERLQVTEQHLEVAKAGALTSSAMVTTMIDRAWEGHEPPAHVKRLREASAAVAKLYGEAAAVSGDELSQRAAQLLRFHDSELRTDKEPKKVPGPKKKS